MVWPSRTARSRCSLRTTSPPVGRTRPVANKVRCCKSAACRRKKKTRFTLAFLYRLTIDAPGKGKTVIARKGENWTIANKNNAPANSSEVRRLIDTLQNEQVTRSVENVASNVPKYVLD